MNLRTDSRITIVGGTGDGKTTLALHLLASIAKNSRVKVVILNPAAEDKYYDLFGEPTTEINQKWPDVQHIVPKVYRDPREYGRLIWPSLQRGNVYTLIDELAILGTGSRYSLALQYLYQMGRRRNCGVTSISQRPRAIPVFSYVMADHLLIGDILGDDLGHIEKVTSQHWKDVINQRQPHEFLYWSRWEKQPPRRFSK